MVAGVAAAMVISVVATCAGSLYYCNKPKEYMRKVSAKIRDDISGECADCMEKESRVHIEKENRTERQCKNSSSSIVKEQQADDSEKFMNDCQNRDAITLDERKRETIFLTDRENLIPVRPPRRRQVISYSSGQFSSIGSRRSSRNNESTDLSHVIDNGHGIKCVKAQIESYPRGISSSSKEIPNSLKSESSIRVVNSVIEESTLKPLGERLVTSLDTKNDSSEKVTTRKTINEETEVSSQNIPPRSSFTDRSTMFQVNRMVNASTSTKISSHAQELKEFDNEQIASVEEIWKRSSCNSEEYSITILKEVLSFLCHEEKDYALELSTIRTKNTEETNHNISPNDDSKTIIIQIRKYHQVDNDFRDKSKSLESCLTKIYEKFLGRVETNDKERSKTPLSSTNSTCSLSSSDKSSYYKIRLSEADQAIFTKKNRRKKKFLRKNKRNKLKKIFHCQRNE